MSMRNSKRLTALALSTIMLISVCCTNKVSAAEAFGGVSSGEVNSVENVKTENVFQNASDEQVPDQSSIIENGNTDIVTGDDSAVSGDEHDSESISDGSVNSGDTADQADESAVGEDFTMSDDDSSLPSDESLASAAESDLSAEEQLLGKAAINPGLYYISTVSSARKMICIAGNSELESANVQLGTYVSSNVRIFDIRFDGTYYTIRSLHTGKYLSVEEKGNVIQTESSDTDAQKWQIVSKNGAFSIVPKNGKGTLSAQESVNGSNVQVSDTGITAWNISPAKKLLAGGMVQTTVTPSVERIEGVLQRPEVVISVYGEILVEDTDYTVNISDNGDACTLTITGKGLYTGTTYKTIRVFEYILDEGLYTIQLQKAPSGEMLCVAGNKTDNDTNIQLGPKASSNVRLYYLEPAEEGYYYIRSYHTGKYITAKGSNIVQREKSGSNTQLWEPKATGNSYTLRMKDSTYYIAVKQAAGGANVQLGARTSAFNAWTIKPSRPYICGNTVTYTYDKTVYLDKDTGTFPEPPCSVTLYGLPLMEGIDYTSEYSIDMNSGSGTITLKGTGAYQGTAALKYQLASDARAFLDGVVQDISCIGKTFYLHPLKSPESTLRGNGSYAKNGLRLVKSNSINDTMSSFRASYTSSGFKLVSGNINYALYAGATGVSPVTFQKQDTVGQRWYLYAHPDGSHSIINALSGFALTMDGNDVITLPYYGLDAQKFILEETGNVSESSHTISNAVKTYVSDAAYEWTFIPATKDTVIYLTKEDDEGASVGYIGSGVCFDMKNKKISVLKGFKTFTGKGMSTCSTVALSTKGIVPEVGRKYKLVMERTDSFKVRATLTDLQTGKSVSTSVNSGAGHGWGVTKQHVYGKLSYSQISSRATNKDERIGILGDSYTEGSSLGTMYMQRYASVTESLWGEDFAISAKSGAQSADGLKWLNDYYLDTYHPEYVVLEFGMNDKNYATWLSNMKKMISLLTAHGITPILSTIPPNCSATKQQYNEIHHEMSNWVRRSGYRYIDWEYYMSKDHARLEVKQVYFLPDGLHPTASAHKLVANQFYRVLTDLYSGSN